MGIGDRITSATDRRPRRPGHVHRGRRGDGHRQLRAAGRRGRRARPRRVSPASRPRRSGASPSASPTGRATRPRWRGVREAFAYQYTPVVVPTSLQNAERIAGLPVAIGAVTALAGGGDADPRPARLRAPPAPRARRVQVARLHPPPGDRRGDDGGDRARRRRPRHRHPARRSSSPAGAGGSSPTGSAWPPRHRSRWASSPGRSIGVLVVANLAAAVPGWRAGRIPAAEALRAE